MAYQVSITMLLDVSTDAAACDAVNEILREHQRSFSPGSCLVDYAVSDPSEYDINLTDYAEGAFAAEDLIWREAMNWRRAVQEGLV